MVLPSSDVGKGLKKRVRLAYLVSHPIQYQAPLLRRIAQEPDIDLTVFFGSDFSVRSYQDEGFGVDVKWDVPLLEGYRHKFLPVIRDDGTQTVTTPLNYGIFSELRGRDGEPGFDLLWTHGYNMVNALHGMVAAKALGIPVLVRADMWLRDRARSGPKLLLKTLFFQFLKNIVDGVLPVGTLNTEYWRHYLGDDVPLFVMPYAVDNDYFQRRSLEAAATRDAFRRELGLDAGRPVILFASKLQQRKHCSDLIDAYGSLINDESDKPRPYLLIVGDGEERVALEEQASSHGLTDVRFCGFRNQSELPRFFDLASVFVLPARHEPWGLVVNEVMNAGRAVILSDDIGCQPDLVTDGVEGYVFPVRDVTALAEALRRVLATPEAAAQMGQRALDRINAWSFEEDIQALRRAIAQLTRKIIA
ncbi:glycosyltransferase family 4 protein [Tunturibacter empetritectus]|uniref:Glycosyltransferase involved in cell wall biosynthesis n=1 Tax=Tunturiibacter empetritectus TaxID=3069691 RepID=A0A7W8IFQ3_9BACT|nr:glycosyltransferase family 4 protein [Edaphobacter lichenicola]MBB5315501.1 glycosyltransferase involved in cell wall biosynthesis [Edaphobacter lichenicola]